jgi:hypothetical protein
MTLERLVRLCTSRNDAFEKVSWFRIWNSKKEAKHLVSFPIDMLGDKHIWFLVDTKHLLVVGNCISNIDHDLFLISWNQCFFELTKMLAWFELKQKCSRKLHELIHSKNHEGPKDKFILDVSSDVRDINAYLVTWKKKVFYTTFPEELPKINMQSPRHGVVIYGKPSLDIHNFCFAPCSNTWNFCYTLPKWSMCPLIGGNLGWWWTSCYGKLINKLSHVFTLNVWFVFWFAH